MPKDKNIVANNGNKLHENATVDTKKVKYRIAEVLAKYPSKVQAQMRKKIVAKCSVGRNTLSHWENIEVGSKRMIAAEHLAVIAEITYCEIKDLLPDENGG